MRLTNQQPNLFAVLKMIKMVEGEAGEARGRVMARAWSGVAAMTDSNIAREALSVKI
jgi:hypothetical protein